MIARRSLLSGTAAAMAVPMAAKAAPDGPMFGLIGRMKAHPGKRAELAAILLEGIGAMPGCRSYVIAEDGSDADSLWITEVWDDADSHKASLALPQVRAAIARARPLIAGFDDRHETRVLGGSGL